MMLRTSTIYLLLFASWILTIPTRVFADEKDQQVITFVDDVKPILRKYCLKCHGNDEQNADLNMQNYSTLIQGGSAGAIVKSGQAESSILYLAITNEDEEARMPPDSEAIPTSAITTIRNWINSGLRETSSSKALGTKQTLTFKPSESASMKPDGDPAMPLELPKIDIPVTLRPMGILAVASSPWAPVAAASGYKHIRLFNTDDESEIGRLPFPEGVPHVLTFSRNGALLLAAGGQPGHSGTIVLYDVKAGTVVGRFGDELDTVLAADISPNQKLVALGGPGRVVKVYSTETGDEVYRITRHTDWITAIAFSPDGKQIATADRAGNLYLSSADEGGILLSLASHKGSIRGLSWRADSRVLASAGDDGKLIWWNAESGFVAMQTTNGHTPVRPEGVTGKLPKGVLSVRFRKDGLLVSTGRDNSIRVWKTNSDQPHAFSMDAGIPIQAAIDYTGKKYIVGDSLGNLQFWSP